MSEIQIKQLGAKWETQIKKGNCYFQSAAFEDAYPHYMQAMVVSELLLENVTTVPKHNSLHLPGMYFTSCINIACNYWKMQDLKNAADYFLYCTYKLKLLSDETNIDPIVKQEASFYWLKAVALYTEFAAKTGMSMPDGLDKNKIYNQLQHLKKLFVLGKENMN